MRAEYLGSRKFKIEGETNLPDKAMLKVCGKDQDYGLYDDADTDWRLNYLTYFVDEVEVLNGAFSKVLTPAQLVAPCTTGAYEVSLSFVLSSQRGAVKRNVSGGNFDGLEVSALTTGDKEFATADPYDLSIGATYQVSRRTPIMPATSLGISRNATDAEALSALESKVAQMTQLQPPGQFAVQGKKDDGGTPWYKVHTSIGTTGWINSTALLGQDLKRIK
jgi:hypothetical protein